ncbi:MAG: vWA domain-containing protein [Acidimicrobiales bacterium]
MLDVLAGFVLELREAGLPVSLSETLDAAEAMGYVEMGDREELKYALAATLVKSPSHWRAFETAFEVYFALRGEKFAIDATSNDPGEAGSEKVRPEAFGGHRGAGGGGGEALGPQEVAEMLMRALWAADMAMLAAAARYAVGRFAGMEPGRPVGGTYYLYRTLRNLDLDRIAGQMLDAAREEAPAGHLTPLEERLVRDEIGSRIALLRKEIEAEIRRRLVADRGTEALAKSLRKPLLEDVDFMHASRDEMAALRRVVQPLTRKLAVRLARKRRHGRKGPLDFRATVRRSLSTGGVPVDPRFRYPHPAKPEVVVVADVSGSVASFARFTLHLVHALSTQFSKVRSFAFIDGIDEVTRFFEESDDVVEALERVSTEAQVVWVDGHSDYGHALGEFWERWGEELSPRTSVIILGDARNNYHASQAWVLAELMHRVRHVYWLNPEPRAYWDTGDSIVGEYSPYCSDVVECRNLRQLESFVAGLA